MDIIREKGENSKRIWEWGLRSTAGTSLSQVTSVAYAMKSTMFMNIGLHSNLQNF